MTDENKNPLLENYDIDKLGLKPIEKAKKIEKDEKLISATDFLIAIGAFFNFEKSLMNGSSNENILNKSLLLLFVNNRKKSILV